MFIIINILLLVKIQISAVIKMTPQVLRSLIINLIISSYKYIMLLSVCTRFNHGIKIHKYIVVDYYHINHIRITLHYQKTELKSSFLLF